jgi:hypothetical protein
MKRRVRKIANFFAFNLLFFALYLNFIHQNKTNLPVIPNNSKQATAAFSGTVLVDAPQQSNTPASTVASGAQEGKTGTNENVSLKLSIN